MPSRTLQRNWVEQIDYDELIATKKQLQNDSGSKLLLHWVKE